MSKFVGKLSKLFKDDGRRAAMPTSDDNPARENKVMIEAFEWYSPADGQHWKRLKSILPSLQNVGVDKIWIPPACKAGWQGSNGYDVYDLYDLGEFDQKGSVGTKWGTKEELVELSRAVKAYGMGLLFDAVLSHRAAADYTERVKVQKVDPDDRRRAVGDCKEIEAWLGFNYHGRDGKYSQMSYSASHFNGTDYDNMTKEKGIFRLADKTWAKDVDRGQGNFDFLLCNNVDLSDHEVRQDLKRWVDWVGEELNLSGLRLDAVKHMSQGFMKEYIQHIRHSVGPDWFLVGEYASYDHTKTLMEYINKTNGEMRLFDFPLLRNFIGISRHTDADLRYIFGDTLSEKLPGNSVTFVRNHDTQGRADNDEAKLEDDFLPVAYAVILLNIHAGYPCLFWGDLFGVNGPEGPKAPQYGSVIYKLLMMRKLYAYGPQKDYLDNRSCIGFTRLGHKAHANGAGLAVVISKAKEPQRKGMSVGKQHAGERWREALDSAPGEVIIDPDGWGIFPIDANQGAGRLSVWCNSEAEGWNDIDEVELGL